jgi:hypothetical protein
VEHRASFTLTEATALRDEKVSSLESRVERLENLGYTTLVTTVLTLAGVVLNMIQIHGK